MQSVQGAPKEVHLLEDKEVGLYAAIVVHSTALGPAAGGCRFWSYPTNDAVLEDACRLAEGMSYKNALANLPLGGGKSVIMRPEGDFDRLKLFRSFGDAVQHLAGQYVTAEDVGTTVKDMRVIAERTQYVAGLPPQADRPGGDPSPWTARGVFLSMELAALRRLGKPLSECTVAIQGVGNVGASLAEMLHAAGAHLVVADVNREGVSRLASMTGATVAAVEDIVGADADIFAPCALGAVLNHSSIKQLKARVVCGAANNQLATPEDGNRLADAGVLYAPDYVVNAGGIINVAAEYLGWSSEEAMTRVDGTASRLRDVLDHATSNGMATHAAADDLARSIISEGVRRDALVEA